MTKDLGLLCPGCNSVFQLDVDIDGVSDEGATTVHCPKCKNHPALLLLSKYKTMVFKGVKQYPPVLIEVVSK